MRRASSRAFHEAESRPAPSKERRGGGDSGRGEAGAHGRSGAPGEESLPTVPCECSSLPRPSTAFRWPSAGLPLTFHGLPSQVLSEWEWTSDGRLTGRVHGKRNYKDGTRITTSVVARHQRFHTHAVTESGTVYLLAPRQLATAPAAASSSEADGGEVRMPPPRSPPNLHLIST